MTNKVLDALTAVFDVDAVDIDRFFFEPLLAESPPGIIIIEDSLQYDLYKRNGRFRDGNVVCTEFYDIDRLCKLLKINNIQKIFINAHRIVDIQIIVAARRAGCKVIYIQHGMYIPFMKRTISFFLRKFRKTFRYLYYAFDIAKNEGDYKVLANLFGIHVLGVQRNVLQQKRHFFPDYNLIFSKFWKQWHINNYSFPVDAHYLEIGAHDFRKFKFEKNRLEDGIVYCYQTLVEDGRIDWSVMKGFYHDFAKFCRANSLRCVIKWHPRGDAKILNYLTKNFNFEVISGDLVEANYVVGHYSSLLALWGIRGSKIICVKLPGHDIDSSIKPWVNVFDSIRDVNLKYVKKSSPEVCSQYFGADKKNDALLYEINEFTETL